MEYIRLEEELRCAERLALMDTLGGTVSHEIRNALGALCLHVDLLEEILCQEHTSLRPQTHEVLTDIKTGLTRLQEIVHDSLLLVRLQHLQREPVDLGTFLATVIQELQVSCAAHGIIVRIQGVEFLGKALLHRSTFRRALVNLVQNAIEAMPQGGLLTLHGHRTASTLTLAVQDTGRGIPTAQLPLLFTPLYTTKPDGTGLGLSIVREIVAAHEGTITVASAPGHGTTFTITLPPGGVAE